MSQSESKIEILNPCAYSVSGVDSKHVEVYLGCDIGLAIFDSEAQLGGVFNVVLPEPSGNVTYFNPVKYARTGIPKFIEALCELGAKRERMKATLAGGGLFGPISIIEPSMDIGGHTAMVTRDVLTKEGVQVEHSEIGDYFSCKLTVDFNTLNAFITTVGKVSHYTEPFEKLTLENLDGAIQKVKPIPQISLKVIKLINSNSYSMKEIAAEVRKDQVISAKVINISNSALYSPKKRIDSIDQALVMLGEKAILQIIVSASLDQFFQASSTGYSMGKGGLSHHAIGTAKITEKLSEFTKKGSTDIAYTAGLLHDIGKVVLDQYVAAAAPQFYERVYSEKMDLVHVEREVLGIDHNVVGDRLAELWKLPENLREAIAYHHQPEKAEIDPDLALQVYLADLLMSRFHVGKMMDRIDTEKFTNRINALGIAHGDFYKLLEFLPWESFLSDELAENNSE